MDVGEIRWRKGLLLRKLSIVFHQNCFELQLGHLFNELICEFFIVFCFEMVRRHRFRI